MSNDLVANYSLNPNSISAFTGVNVSEGMMRNLVNNGMRQFASTVKANFAANAGTITTSSILALASISTGDYILLTPSGGSTSISSFGDAPEGLSKRARALGTITLRHDTTKLNLPGGTDLTISTGDELYMRAQGGTVWNVIPEFTLIPDGSVSTAKLADLSVTTAKLAESVFSSLSAATIVATDYLVFSDASDSGNKKKGLVSDVKNLGPIVNRYYAEYTSNADLSTAIPFDDTIPTSSEGTEVLSVSVTTTTATQRVRINFSAFGQCSNASGHIAAAFFRDTTCVGVTVQDAVFNTVIRQWSGAAEDAPGAAATYTYSVRVGSNVGTVRLNGSTAARVYGGAAKATMIVDLIEP